jgi:glycosyltransferase involved in cell wall biosynthesis
MRMSIVVPCYNEERHIRACVESLLAQDYPEDRFEILIVDNNSTDRSAEIVREYPRARLLREPIQGDFASRNRGLMESTGEVLAFTDADTAPDPDWLSNIAKTMADPKLGIIVGKLRFGPGRALAMLEAYEEEKGSYVFSTRTPEIYFGYTCNMVVRRSLFDRLGAFPEVQRNSDIVFLRRALEEYSCDVAVYGADVQVRRLEVPTVWAYFAKQRVYGRDYRRYAAVADVQPLSYRLRWEIFRRATRGRGYSALQSAMLLALLAIGALNYDVSRWLAGRKLESVGSSGAAGG